MGGEDDRETYPVPIRVELTKKHDLNPPAVYPRRVPLEGWWLQRKRIDLLYAYLFCGNYFYVGESSIKDKARRNHQCQLQELPLDVQEEIVARLPATSILKLQLVCRNWYAMSHAPSTIVEHLAHANNAHLAIHRGYGRQDQQLHLIETTGRGYAVFRLSPLRSSMRIIGSSNGILCLRELCCYPKQIYLYNPLLGGEFLELPEHRIIPLLSSANYGFYFDHARSAFKVVIFIYGREHDDYDDDNFYETETFLIETCTIAMVGGHIGTPQPWKVIKSEIYLNHCFDYIHPEPLILLNGKLHGLVNERIITSFDIASEEITFMPLHFLDETNYNSKLGELGGCLFVTVFVQADVLEIWVMKDYHNQESWTKQLTFHDTFRENIFPYMLNDDDIFLLPDSGRDQPNLFHHTPSLICLPSAKPTSP